MIFQIANTWLRLPQNHVDLGVRISTLLLGERYETMILGGALDATTVVDTTLEEALESHIFWIKNHDHIAENSGLLPEPAHSSQDS